MPHSSDATRLSHQLHVLRRGAWLVLLAALLVTGAAVGVSLRQDPLFRASADVFLESESFAADLTEVQGGDPERDIKTQARLARLPAVAERALEEAYQKGSPQDLLDDSGVTTTGEADILTFSVTATSRESATGLATAYAKAYTDYRREIDTRALVAARKRVESQLVKLRESGVKPTSTLYLTFEKRRGELRTVEALRGSKALLVRSATSPAQIQPKPVRNAILGGFLGLFLGIALVLLRDALNTRLRTAEEIEERLGVPLLARIPDVAAKRGASVGLTMLTQPREMQAEAFRILATNIEFTNADSGAQTIMVTSANRAEGKSTTLANLAAAFARRGQRVVLADLDLRRPTVASLFGIDPTPGATDVALGHVTLDEALVRVPLMDLGAGPQSGASTNGSGDGAHHRSVAETGILEVLPAGTLPPDASEFVASRSMLDLIERLGQRADLVLFDAPPILSVSDSLALSSHVDAVIVVTRLANIRRPVLNELRRVLETAPVVKLGLVVTGVSQGEGYGYGYGYGHATTGRSGPPAKDSRPRRLGRRRDRVG